jgi:hypothetical protein
VAKMAHADGESAKNLRRLPLISDTGSTDANQRHSDDVIIIARVSFNCNIAFIIFVRRY